MLVTVSTPGSPNGASLRVQLVSHSHWDREWYHPAGRFRQRLVALVDALLDTAVSGSTDGSAKSPFLLDGQAIVLQDYIAVRPEREPELRHLLRTGALEAGPWFVLADNLIPSGEAILRNLEAGRRVLERLGATAPPVAYCPDSFGHPAAMPDIAAGYGFSVAVLWRGFGGPLHPGADTVWWRGLSDARVLLHHLPPDGYETGSSLPVDDGAAMARWTSLAPLLVSRNRIGIVLLTSGADHHARQVDLTAAIDAANRVATAVQLHSDARVVRADDVAQQGDAARFHVERASLRAATARLFDAATDAEAHGTPIPLVHGELRDSYGYTWALQGTFGTRAHEKRRNALLERALCVDAEPWLALALLHGDRSQRPRDGSIGVELLPPLLAAAWDTLLTTHPHDTLCGCSVDDVARAMEVTQESVNAQQAGLREAALALALRHDRVAARSRRPDDRLVVVRNRAARARGGIAEIRLLTTIGDVPVGPGSAGAPPVIASTLDATGTCPVLIGIVQQEISERLVHDRRESPQHYPDDDIVREHRVVAWVPPVPAHGLRVMECDEQLAAAPGAVQPVRRTTIASPQPVNVVERGDDIHISNGYLELLANARGLTVRQGERLLPDALSVESVQDWGDSYTPSLRGPVTALALQRVRIRSRGPLRVSVELNWRHTERDRVLVPGDVERHEQVVRSRTRRASVAVTTTLILDAEARHLRCDVRARNDMPDHRLQLVWHTDVQTAATVRADAAFGHVERKPVDAPAGSAETPPGTMPLHRWLSSCDTERGATLISDGLAEGEASGARLAVTLVRSIGELSRGDLPERPGHAGWPCRIPLAQCRGTFHARVGLLLHPAWSDETLESIEDATDDLLLPLVGETWRDLSGDARLLPGPELSGFGLRASAVTMARDGKALLLRARNLTDQVRAGAWILPGGHAWRVTECRLDETPVADAYECLSRVEFSVAPRGLLTLRIARVGG